MTIHLDGRRMCSRAEAHAYLQEALSLPDYYGKNLDALYDLLTERGEPTEIILEHFGQMHDGLGRYAKLMAATFSQAAQHNEALTFQMTEE